mmetsp:Transcript_8690/g.18717  ORF Transcript_8690/g.18717 Transcript_8690/m.18717 type:complete len:131 (+) Transcript_8690:149-541(+)
MLRRSVSRPRGLTDHDGLTDRGLASCASPRGTALHQITTPDEALPLVPGDGKGCPHLLEPAADGKLVQRFFVRSFTLAVARQDATYRTQDVLTLDVFLWIAVRIEVTPSRLVSDETIRSRRKHIGIAPHC